MDDLNNQFFNAHHSPIGAFASFTLGFPGANGGLGLELGAPAKQNVYIGAESADGQLQAMPFFESDDVDESARFTVEQGVEEPAPGPRIAPFDKQAVARDFQVATDTWTAGDISFRVLSPVMALPDPETASEADMRLATCPAVLAELTLDNRAGERPRTAFFGFQGSDPYTAMRRIDDTTDGRLKGIGQGRCLAIASADDGVRSGLGGFTIESAIIPDNPDNLVFGLGPVGACTMTAAPGEVGRWRFAVCFHRDGLVTAGLDCRYFYMRYFEDIEQVAEFALAHFDDYAALAESANREVAEAPLNAEQAFMLSHAVRSYYGSTQFFELPDKRPLWVVNEGEYRMMNTFDLTVDMLFHEMKMNPWTVKNVLDMFIERYSYTDSVRFPNDDTEHPGGISFTHDMGVANVFSRPHYSAYELFGLDGCFSHMTHEQLTNWVCCATVYLEQTGDTAWRDKHQQLFEDCLDSMLNRDNPAPEKRNGVMSLDSSRTMGGAEITTYDSLDVSLGQARNNIYMAVKCWAAYLGLERVLGGIGRAERAAEAAEQARRCADTLLAHVGADGTFPAVIDENCEARIIPVIEGLVFPYFNGRRDALEANGPYGTFLEALKTHLQAILRPGVCVFEDGGWKISSTSNNSWLSKIYLCQFVARQILGLPWDEGGRASDRAHARWLRNPELSHWSWSDQILGGKIYGSKYYPRGVTAILWLDEPES